MKTLDDNDRLQAGTLPADPMADTEIVRPLEQPDTRTEGPRPRLLSERLEGITEDLARTHGKAALGLLTGLEPLDSATLGLRGLMLLSAPPGVGKTSLGLDLGWRILATHPEALGRACFVFFSFEMSAAAMVIRLVSNTTQIPWRTLRLGESVEPGADGLRFGTLRRTSYEAGIRTLSDAGTRLVIYDSEDLPPRGLTRPAEWLRAHIDAAKAAARCDRAFALIDNLQAIPVPEDPAGKPWANDLERDRYVMAELLRVARGAEEQDAVMVISEQAKAGFGSSDLASVLGTGRAVYSPDVVIFLRPEPEDEDDDVIVNGRKIPIASTEEHTDVDLVIVKARDGMRRGPIPLTFHHGTHRYDVATRAPFTRKKARKKG